MKTNSEQVGESYHSTNVNNSRRKLLKTLSGANDITLIRPYGNIGDDLILAGTRQLLCGADYSEISLSHLQSVHGHTAILAGSGGWCGAYTILPKYLPLLETRFKNVIVFPSSYDDSIDAVNNAVKNSRALFFAREEISYNKIKNICNAEIAHDCAFFFNYDSYKRKGKGILNAFREDNEAKGYPVPELNNDLSLSCSTLDEWLWAISKHESISTDRAHIMIAGALLGKQVEYRSSNYHKLPAIADFALKDFPVSAMDDTQGDKTDGGPSGISLKRSPEYGEGKGMNEVEKLWQVVYEIASVIPAEEAFILADEEQIRYELGKASPAIAFMNKEGKYCGPPLNDDEAITAVKQLCTTSCNYVVFAWPAFWWLEYYIEFARYLRLNFNCILSNDRLIVFHLLP